MKPKTPHPLKRSAAQLELAILAGLLLQSVVNITATIYATPAGAPVTAVVLANAALAAAPFLTAKYVIRYVRIQRVLARRGAR
jgi:hypothetical protein